MRRRRRRLETEDSPPLGGNNFLYSFTCPDPSGAYNYPYGLLIAAGGNPATARPVKVDWPIKIGDLMKNPALM